MATACCHDLRRRLGPDDDEHVVAPRKARLCAAQGGVLVEQDDRCPGPRPAGLGRIQHAEHLAARRRGEAEHAVEQVGIGHHHEPAAAVAPRALGVPAWRPRRSGLRRRPWLPCLDAVRRCRDRRSARAVRRDAARATWRTSNSTGMACGAAMPGRRARGPATHGLPPWRAERGL